MSDANIEARAGLSAANRRTLEAFFRHPLANNLDRIDVAALFTRLGSVEHGENTAVTYRIGDEHHRVGKSRGHSLMTDEVIDLRHLLTRAGWGPATPKAGAAEPESPQPATPGDWLAVVEVDEARLYHLDIHAADKTRHTLQAHDQHRILRHLQHAEQGRDEARRTEADHKYFEMIAQALVPGGEIVLIGHGAGHSNAAQMFESFLLAHHPLMFRRVVNAVVADIERLTDPQLLDLARAALTA